MPNGLSIANGTFFHLETNNGKDRRWYPWPVQGARGWFDAYGHRVTDWPQIAADYVLSRQWVWPIRPAAGNHMSIRIVEVTVEAGRVVATEEIERYAARLENDWRAMPIDIPV